MVSTQLSAGIPSKRHSEPSCEDVAQVRLDDAQVLSPSAGLLSVPWSAIFKIVSTASISSPLAC